MKNFRLFNVLLLAFFILSNIQETFAQATITAVSIPAASSSICSAGSNTFNVNYTASGTFGANNTFTAELSSPTGSFASPVAIGTRLNATNSGAISATIPAGTASGTGYLIRVTSNNPGRTSSGTAAITITFPTGNPSVFGNGAWNAYAYGDNTYTNYYGFYTENNVNLSSITRWDQNSTPSAADASSGNAYIGCVVPADQHSVSYKRTNFSCGLYQIDITGNDDAAILLINNVQVWNRATASGVTATNVWSGFLEPTSTIEFKWEEDYGQSYGRLNINTSTALPVAIVSTAGSNCTNFTANWNAFNNATNYFIDVATDAAFTSIVAGYNNLSTGNVTSKLITGLTAGTEYFYRVRAANTTCGLTTGNSNVISSKIAVSPAGPVTICQGESVTLTASNANSYTWSPSTGLSATNTAVVTASPTTTTTYTVSADGTGCNTKSITINVNPTSGNPTVFGNGAWNVYAYNGYNFTTYYGTYTENNLSFNSTTRWDQSTSPSYANNASGNAYAGCPVPVDLHSVSYKRTNLPCGLYQIDITGHDDDGYLLIDGTQVWVHNGCCDSHTNVWIGFLNPSSTVEFRWKENGGSSYGSVNLNPVAVPTTNAATPGANCTQFNANWSPIINASSYFLDVATDAAFTSFVTGYNNLNVGNLTTYLVSGLTAGTNYFYRVRAYNSGCSLTSGNSNTTTTQVQVSTSTVVICDGGSAVLTASNASTYSWSPATGLSATTGSSVTTNTTVNTVYTVTGTTAGGCTSTSTITVIADTIGNPNTFGNGFWNVYCYNNTFSTYRGKYTENSLSFNSTNRWAQGLSPSSANATGGNPYTGCPVTNDTHGVSYKRTNFACGLYQIDVPAHDDDAYLLINGVQVWVHNGCCDAHTNVWTGFLNATSTVEFRWQDNTGSSFGSVNITNVTTSPAAFTTSSAAVCQGANSVTYTIPAYNNATSYTWSYSGSGVTITGASNTVTVNYSNTATSGTLSVIANNSCGVSSSARTLAITVNPLPGQPGTFTTSSPSVCQGQTAVAYTVGASSPAATSYAWTYTGGTGATITGTTASVTVNYSSTATSGTLNVSGVNACGTSVTSRTLAITVNSTPYTTAGSSSPACSGTTLNLTATNSTGGTFAWTGPNSFTSSSQNPSLTYSTAAAGTYTVTTTLGTCTATSSTVVATNTGSSGLWVGGTSTDWHTGSNWCGGTVPASTTDVTIPVVTNLPVITATANAKALTISSSSTLTKNSTGTLNVYGDFTNNGTFTDNGIYTDAGVVVFKGAVAQNINGTVTFNNLTINNSNGVSLNSMATVNGILTLTAGNFTTNGNLNQNLYNGAIAGTGSGTTSGNIRFFKTIWGDRYHYLSSPISGLTAADWNDNETIKFGAYSNLYTYDETVPDSNKLVGWKPVTSTSTALNDMQGYAFFFKRYTYNTLLDVSGAYNHSATYSISLTNTPSTTPVAKPASDGWQLVGNPYPTTLDWTSAGWTKTNITAAIYMWDGRTNKYASYVGTTGTNGGTKYIGSMQAFFVKVTNPGSATLGVNGTARITSTLKDVFRTEDEQSPDDILRITASSGDFDDETVIRFNSQATVDFDSEWDAYKLPNSGSSPSLSSESPNVDYSINSLPNTLSQKSIPLTLVTAFAGDYTFTTSFTGFTNNQSIWLEDRALGTLQNLRDNATYTAAALSQGTISGRFFIQYTNNKQETVTGTTNAQYNKAGIEIASYMQTLSILFPNSNSGEANVTLFDALGKKVFELQNVEISSGKIETTVSLPTGIYIVKVTSAQAAASKQVYLSK